MTKACFSIFAILSLCIASFATSKAAEPVAALKPREGYVVVKARGRVKSLTFQRFQSEDSFSVDSAVGAKLLAVKAGRYYVKSGSSMYSNTPPHIYAEPTEPSQTIVVQEGAVTYIGDWIVSDEDGRYLTKVHFDSKTVVAALKDNKLVSGDVWMCETGKSPVKLVLQ